MISQIFLNSENSVLPFLVGIFYFLAWSYIYENAQRDIRSIFQFNSLPPLFQTSSPIPAEHSPSTASVSGKAGLKGAGGKAGLRKSLQFSAHKGGFNRFRKVVARLRGLVREQDLGADVAHQLKTPLAVMKMRLTETADFEGRHRLEQDLIHMESVVETMLMSARLDRTRTRDFQSVDLNAVCRDVAADTAPYAVSKGHQFEFLTEVNRAPRCKGDAQLIAQAIHVCLENAIKYSQTPGEITLILTPDGVEVRDRGPGVLPQDRKRIFHAHTRGGNTLGQGGSGLGLSIASRIVALHGGHISVQDRSGGGAVFSLCFSI